MRNAGLTYAIFAGGGRGQRIGWVPSLAEQIGKHGANVHSRKLQGLLRKGVWRWGKREIIYLSLQCHHHCGFCIKVGSDESHFNVSVLRK